MGNTLGGVGNAAAGEATRGGEGALAAGAAAGLAGAGGEAGVEPGAHPTFTVVAGDPIEPYAQGVALGDLNADGKVDMVLASDLGYARVRFGNGDGTFLPEVNYEFSDDQPFAAADVAIADLNADGKPDLALIIAGSPPGGDVAVLLNQGSGSFAEPVLYASGRGTDSYQSVIAAVDLNGNEAPDLAIAGGAVLLSAGPASFAKAVQYRAATTKGLAAGDLNRDSAPDLVLTTGSGIQVALNNTDGTFAAPTLYDTMSMPYRLAVGDLNADGNPDVVAALPDADAAAVFYARNDGSLSDATYYAVGPDPWAVAIGDLNGDLRPDLMFASYDTSIPFIVIVNDGHGAFSAPAPFAGKAGDGFRKALALADLNDDGKQDLVVVGHNASAKNVFLNTTPY